MVKIDTRPRRYAIFFKRKDLRPNKIDDKLELFRHIIGLEDTSDILELNRYTGDHKTDEIRIEKTTVSDINLYDAPFLTARLTNEQVIRLKKDPNVDYVILGKMEPLPVQFIGWNHRTLHSVDANRTNTYNVRGKGVNVAFLDSGCEKTHQDLTPRITVNQTFLDDGGDAGPARIPNALPSDHGTKAIGMIAMSDNDIGSVGYAPECNIWNLRVYAWNGSFVGSAPPEQFLAMAFAYTNNAHVVGCNVQGPRPPDIIAGYERLSRPAYDTKGILTTSAAGNQNRRGAPGEGASGAYGVYGVSALNRSLLKASYSNYGPDVDFCNPAGEYGPDDIIQVTTGLNNSYGTFNGTSAACPGMTGCCAIAVAAYRPSECPPYDPAVSKADTLTTALAMSCTQPEGDKNRRLEKNEFYGYGYPELNRLVSILRGEVLD